MTQQGLLIHHFLHTYDPTPKLIDQINTDFLTALSLINKQEVSFPMVGLPNESVSYFTSISSKLDGSWIFLEKANYTPRINPMVFPFPISAGIFPIVNTDDDLSYFQPEQRETIGNVANIVTFIYRVPVLIICINYDSSAPFADFKNPEWWWRDVERDQSLSAELEAIIGRDKLQRRRQYINENVIVLEYEYPNLETLPYDIVNKLSVIKGAI